MHIKEGNGKPVASTNPTAPYGDDQFHEEPIGTAMLLIKVLLALSYTSACAYGAAKTKACAFVAIKQPETIAPMGYISDSLKDFDNINMSSLFDI
jgi:hypothetical protein